jgi:hypothetical protein
MKSYLIIWFSSDGGKPSDINHQLISLGFKPTQGQYDYVIEWGKDVSVEEILNIGDLVQMSLQGLNVMFKLETIQENKTP